MPIVGKEKKIWGTGIDDSAGRWWVLLQWYFPLFWDAETDPSKLPAAAEYLSSAHPEKERYGARGPIQLETAMLQRPVYQQTAIYITGDGHIRNAKRLSKYFARIHPSFEKDLWLLRSSVYG